MTLSAGECNSDFLISTLVHGGEGVKYGTNSPYSQEAMHFGTKSVRKIWIEILFLARRNILP